MAMSLLGILLENQGKREVALICHTEALDLLKRIRPEDHPNLQSVKERMSALNENERISHNQRTKEKSGRTLGKRVGSLFYSL
jgi:hypothetical protein